MSIRSTLTNKIDFMHYVGKKYIIKLLSKLLAFLLGPDYYIIKYCLSHKDLMISYTPCFLDIRPYKRSFSFLFSTKYNSNLELFKKYPNNIIKEPP